MKGTRFSRLLSLLVAGGLLLVAGCGPASPSGSTQQTPTPPAPAVQPQPTQGGAPAKPAGERPVVRVVVSPGLQAFPIDLIQQQKLDEKHGFRLQRQDVASFTAIYTALQAGEVDIGFPGWHAAAANYAKGIKTVNIFPMLEFTNDVLVRKDSPFKDLGDLKGKKIGGIAGPAGATTAYLRVVAVKHYGYDPVKQSTMQFGAAPVLLNGLINGDIDAMLSSDPQTTQALLGGKVRSLGDLNEIWAQKGGKRQILNSIAAREEWVNSNPAAAKSFLAAYREAANHINGHPEVWVGFAEAMGIKSAEGAEMLRKRNRGYLTDWNADTVADMKAFAKAAIEIIGPEFMPSVPDAAFRLDFNP